MKNLIKKIVPKSAKRLYRSKQTQFSIIRDYVYDYRKFKRESASFKLRNKEMMQAYILKEYHAVEKGLALSEPRPGFGGPRIGALADIVEDYLTKYGVDAITDMTADTLREYLDFDEGHAQVAPGLKDKLERLLLRCDESRFHKTGGTKLVPKQDIMAALDFDFERFFKSRNSVRDFSDEPVSTATLLKVIDTARYTPSVCNRQSWKVYVIEHSNVELKRKLLNVQNGNKGFGEQISSLIVITGKLSSFFAYERNQVYIDGGMFAMSIVLGLHAEGLGVCCLNTSYAKKQYEAFTNSMEMDSDCAPIMFLAVGHLKDNYSVAISERRPLTDIVEVR
ncbi:nitroreductase family protein [Pedobacter gandavensis]|uniref:nitroreductase family protein n=1 Tax=Pedobacter gandavensis TaxID=2679963 RepID=UPI00292E92AB|nr:nitroreductase family protein [Pedobacter gandavensis]